MKVMRGNNMKPISLSDPFPSTSPLAISLVHIYPANLVLSSFIPKWNTKIYQSLFRAEMRTVYLLETLPMFALGPDAPDRIEKQTI